MKPTVRTRTYTTTEVVRLIGCTYRQLDYWCRVGLIPGQAGHGVGSGRRRTWDDEDVERARRVYLASQLTNMGLSKAVDLLEQHIELERIEVRLLDREAVA